MPEAPILTISIPLLLIPPVTHQVAGLSSSLPCRVLDNKNRGSPGLDVWVSW